ncbi:SLIRP protein, partial [Amia calva]|nr:SLIRP protein [Amia calva]
MGHRIKILLIVTALVDSGLFCISEEVREYFTQFGQVRKCLLPFDKETGFHKGYCWVGFTSEDGLQNALQKDPHLVEGSKLQVQRNRRAFAGRRPNQDFEES